MEPTRAPPAPGPRPGNRSCPRRPARLRVPPPRRPTATPGPGGAGARAPRTRRSCARTPVPVRLGRIMTSAKIPRPSGLSTRASRTDDGSASTRVTARVTSVVPIFRTSWSVSGVRVTRRSRRRSMRSVAAARQVPHAGRAGGRRRLLDGEPAGRRRSPRPRCDPWTLRGSAGTRRTAAAARVQGHPRQMAIDQHVLGYMCRYWT